MPTPASRTLAAVLFTDMEGYTALMQRDEALALCWRERHRAVMRATHEQFSGEIIQYFGDGTLSIFSSAAAAVRCGMEIQRRLGEEPRVPLRMGIHLGEILRSADDIVGDAVNIASRIESFSVPGAVLVSQIVADQVGNQPDFSLLPLGKYQLKNVDQPVTLFAVAADGLVVPDAAVLSGKGKRADPSLRNRPVHLTSFIGREQEIGNVIELLNDHRLVTVTGPGGTGKTRLAARVAETVAVGFDNGAYWVELDRVSRQELVAFAIARDLGLGQDALRSTEELLVEFLKEKISLLVLDNFEHVVHAAPLVERLLRQCPQLRILITSRIVLGIAGEIEFPVHPLPLPAVGTALSAAELRQNPAVALFSERARATRRRFELSDDNAAAVAEICIRLDGLPLAIELAAARTKLFNPAALLSRLEHRLDLLKTDNRSRPARHQTLRQTIAWSYDLLGSDEQALFCRLSVFTGGCTLEAAGEVCGRNGLSNWKVEDGVLALVDKSLLQLREEHSEEVRFLMLETIREFAREALQKAQKEMTMRKAHCEYFLHLAERAASQLSGPQQREWLTRLEAEQANFRAAMDFSIESGAWDMAYRLGTALRPFWAGRGLVAEAIQQMERLQQLPDRPELRQQRIKLLQELGSMYFYVPLFPRAAALLREVLEIWRVEGNELELARTLNHLSWSVMHLGEYQQAIMHAEKALALGKKLGDRHIEIGARNNLGWVRRQQARPTEALAHFEKTLELTRALGDERRHGYALMNLAVVRRFMGQYQEAVDLLQQALVIHRRNKDRILIGFALSELGSTYAVAGEVDLAAAVCEEISHLARESSGGGIFLYDQANKIEALVALQQNDLARAGLLIRKIQSLNDKFVAHDRNVESWNILGQIALITEDWTTAGQCARRSLEMDAGRESFLGTITGLQLMGSLRLQLDDLQKGIHFLAKSASLRQQLQMPLPPWEKPRWEKELEGARMRLGEEAFTTAFEEGKKARLEEVVQVALAVKI